MKKFHLLLALFAGFLLNTVTAQVQVNTPYNLGEPFEIGNEEKVSLGKGDFSIMVAELIEDSRCPVGMTCIWEGLIKLKLNVQKNDKIYTKEITMRGSRSATIEVDGYEIKLLSAHANEMMGLKQYSYTFEVSELIVTGD